MSTGGVHIETKTLKKERGHGWERVNLTANFNPAILKPASLRPSNLKMADLHG